jgi:hypothetical protein
VGELVKTTFCVNDVEYFFSSFNADAKRTWEVKRATDVKICTTTFHQAILVAVDHVVVSRVLRLVRWSHVIRDLASVHVNHSWKEKHAMNAREGIILSRLLISLDVKVRYISNSTLHEFFFTSD